MHLKKFISNGNEKQNLNLKPSQGRQKNKIKTVKQIRKQYEHNIQSKPIQTEELKS